MNPNTLFLAPMAGYTDLPFRLLEQKNGVDVLTSEMVSAKGIFYKDKKTQELLKSKGEKNFGIQIFGSDPEILAKVVTELEDQRKKSLISYDFIDFNIGCPAPKIVKNGDGSALLKNLDLLKDSLINITKKSEVPVTLKTRVGFDKDENVIKEVLKIAEDTGISRITIHPRTREQFYSGISDWEIAKEALDIAKIPVVLSGDIKTPEDAKRAYDMGFENLMIGRAAVENPFIFKQVKDFLETGDYKKTTSKDLANFAIDHIKLASELNSNKNNIIALRKHLASYTKGMKEAKKLRQQIFSIDNEKEMIDLFDKVIND